MNSTSSSLTFLIQGSAFRLTYSNIVTTQNSFKMKWIGNLLSPRPQWTADQRRNLISFYKYWMATSLLKQVLINSVTRLGALLHFGQLFKACGNNYFVQITHIFGNSCEGVKIFHFSSEISFVHLSQTFGDFLLVTLLIKHNTASFFLWLHKGTFCCLLRCTTLFDKPKCFKTCSLLIIKKTTKV